MQNKTVCTEDNYCEYTVDIPPSFCSTSSVVDVTVVAVNILGFGRPTEPIILGMLLMVRLPQLCDCGEQHHDGVK